MKQTITLLVAVLFIFTSQAQQKDLVDFENLEGSVSFIPEEKLVEGEVNISFKINKKVDSIFVDGKDMTVELSKDTRTKAKLNPTKKKIWIVHKFKKNKSYSVKFSYKVKNPKKALYFVGWDNSGSNQIWSQGQGHHTSYWLPSIDDKTDKLIFDLTYKTPKNYTVIGNGELKTHQSKEDEEVWHYKMNKPMSSYLVAVAIGDYKKQSLKSTNGTPLELYYEPQDSSKVEPTYRYSKEIFDFLEKEIGVDYPWENYKQIPVRDFLYSGMENTTATIFSESFMTDSIGFVDRNYVSVNAHELAHQWFGNLVTEESSKSHWLQEGFATYYALLAERKIFGDNYFYYKLFQDAEELKSKSEKGKGEALTDPKASSLTFYQKGAWALHILRGIVGKHAFKKGIKNYLEKYKFKNVTTEDFLDEMEKASGQDLTEFEENWLKQSAFRAKDVLESLQNSFSIQKYLEISALGPLDLDDKYNQLKGALYFSDNKFIGQEVVHQLAQDRPSPKLFNLYNNAFATQDISIRQAISESLTEIPNELKEHYESLLNDDSYLTKERALFNLWNNFPENRKAYLDTLKDVQGFYDKNVRMLWLTLSLVTQDYSPDQNPKFYEELSGYTSPEYDYSIRQNAFGHLYQINVFSKQNYRDLMQASTHPVWRFRKFARELLDKLLEEKAHRDKLKTLKTQLSKKEQKVLEKAIEKQKQPH